MIFSVNVAVKFLNFKVFYTDEYSTHNKVHFGGCCMKIREILSVLQGV